MDSWLNLTLTPWTQIACLLDIRCDIKWAQNKTGNVRLVQSGAMTFIASCVRHTSVCPSMLRSVTRGYHCACAGRCCYFRLPSAASTRYARKTSRRIFIYILDYRSEALGGHLHDVANLGNIVYCERLLLTRWNNNIAEYLLLLALTAYVQILLGTLLSFNNGVKNGDLLFICPN